MCVRERERERDRQRDRERFVLFPLSKVVFFVVFCCFFFTWSFKFYLVYATTSEDGERTHMYMNIHINIYQHIHIYMHIYTPLA